MRSNSGTDEDNMYYVLFTWNLHKYIKDKQIFTTLRDGQPMSMLNKSFMEIIS